MPPPHPQSVGWEEGGWGLSPRHFDQVRAAHPTPHISVGELSAWDSGGKRRVIHGWGQSLGEEPGPSWGGFQRLNQARARVCVVGGLCEYGALRGTMAWGMG